MYQLFQNLVGAEKLYRVLLADWLKIEPGSAVLDYGCGCGWVGSHLPGQVRYVGIDPNAHRLRRAKEKNPAGVFLRGDRLNLRDLPTKSFNLIFSVGVLHHLDDWQVHDFWDQARGLLSVVGRVITVDPVRLPGDHALFQCLHRLDAGRHIRDEKSYLKLLSGEWQVGRTQVRHDCLKIPYHHFFLEALPRRQ